MDWQLALRLAAASSIAYLLGGIPWSLIIGLRFYKIDVRNEGSGNLGATNVLRVLGAKAAAATFVLDVAKGSVGGDRGVASGAGRDVRRRSPTSGR